jgi:prevent-host-death family protein
MRTTTISETKARLSALLDEVKAGESILITDRGVPVARLDPVGTSVDPTGRMERLARAGLLRPGKGPLAPRLLEAPQEQAPPGVSLVAMVLEERRSGR